MNKYKETWKSICEHPVPGWFHNEKFGIYAASIMPRPTAPPTNSDTKI